ncbi:MAG: TetR/AcrR family transcriptional regulator [Fimbriimonadaceae bacterium]|nr:TetR/AcrR family transcriptional regulator [Fimbriimonadaceae bacterium]
MAVLPAARASTPDVILDATDRLMARYGFRKMTMDDLAKEAGIGKRTIYLHFRSKEDVGLSSIGRVVEQVHRELREIADANEPASIRLRKMLYRRVMGRIEQVKDYAHSLNELFEVVRPSYMARRAEYFEEEKRLLSRVLLEGARATEDCERRADSIAESMLLATNAFLPYSLTVREIGTPEAIGMKLSAMIDLLLKGITTGPVHNTKEKP